ncbi:MAG: HAD-IA family hydrolase [Candidatus Hydrogenedentes bacterium]|nr:HAD-IA family hydrolase [Candidatus Hydrogenedentota bacterium]
MTQKKYALIFDMDGVLADTEPLIARASIDMFRELYGVELTAEDFRPFIGTGAVRYVEGPAEKIGLKIDLKRALEVRFRNFSALLDAGECRPCPGAIELVRAAADSGEWNLAIATSSPTDKANVTLNAIQAPVDKFDVIITGDMVTHKKPHPEIYIAAQNAVGLPCSQCLVVEDAVTGVQSAKSANLRCLAVTSSFRASDLSLADCIVDSLEHVTLDTLRKVLE